ncbi:hypothetical protein SCUP234_03701 [Seiridium cupressi]
MNDAENRFHGGRVILGKIHRPLGLGSLCFAEIAVQHRPPDFGCSGHGPGANQELVHFTSPNLSSHSEAQLPIVVKSVVRDDTVRTDLAVDLRGMAS